MDAAGSSSSCRTMSTSSCRTMNSAAVANGRVEAVLDRAVADRHGEVGRAAPGLAVDDERAAVGDEVRRECGPERRVCGPERRENVDGRWMRPLEALGIASLAMQVESARPANRIGTHRIAVRAAQHVARWSDVNRNAQCQVGRRHAQGPQARLLLGQVRRGHSARRPARSRGVDLVVPLGEWR